MPVPPITQTDFLVVIGDQQVTIQRLRAYITTLEAEIADLKKPADPEP